MKQLIAPVSIIVIVVAFFVIFERKGVSRHDDVQTVQSESMTANRNPSVSVLQTSPAIEVKPAVKAKSVETKPAAKTGSATDLTASTDAKPKTDAKPTEIKPEAKTELAETKFTVDEAKPVTEKKPVTETTPEEKRVPAAVPVVTEEEAEKLNDVALAEKERREEPFLRLYQDRKIESFCFEGTVRATSTIPDPARNDYDNCLYALFVELDSLLSDISTETKISYEVIVNAPIMKEKTILQDNIFLPGDKVWCTCAEYDAMPQDIQEIQLSDDIQSYEHQQYFSLKIHKIKDFQKGGNRYFAKREITILPLQTIPREEKAVNARKERIQNEIQRIDEELKKHGGSFESWKEEYKPIIEKYNELSSEGYKGWINDSYFACGKGDEPLYKTKEFLEGLQPYKQYLEDNNIDLILVRIPSKWEFARCVLTSDVFQENPAWI